MSSSLHNDPALGNLVLGNSTQESYSISNRQMLVFLLAHIPLGLPVPYPGIVFTIHALLTLVVGLYFALSGDRLERVAYVGAYLVGAELLWRITGAPIFWEFGKYGTVLIFVLALLRNGRFQGPALAFLYFILLLPSVLLTIMELTPADAKDEISFNLSGPLALMACAWFFSNLKLSRDQLLRLFLALIAPVMSIAVLSIYSVAVRTIEFGTESNLAVSGGFGPNQVSAILGLGALLAMLCLFNERTGLWLKATLLVAMIVCLIQSSLTFSRGGLYNFTGATIIALFFLLRSGQSRFKVLIAVPLFIVFAWFVVLPNLNNYTGGALLNRFEDTNPTGRDLIIEADLRTWIEHPMLGVGPGQADSYRAQNFKTVSSHTEFSRMLAEHGIFGLGSLLCLLVMSFQRYSRTDTDKSKAVIASALVWSFLFMMNAGMRIVAPSFMFGLTFATLLSSEEIAAWLVIRRPINDEALVLTNEGVETL